MLSLVNLKNVFFGHWYVFVSIALMALVLWLVYVNRIKDNIKAFSKIRFRSVFLIDPPDKWDSSMKSIVQARVNERMGALAYSFLNDCQAEQSILAPYRNGKTADQNPQSDKVALVKARRQLAKSKRAYRYAHSLGKMYDLYMKDHASDYLNEWGKKNLANVYEPNY